MQRGWKSCVCMLHMYRNAWILDIICTIFFSSAFLFDMIKELDYYSHSFLVGAFSLKEKSPTITVGSFFSADNLIFPKTLPRDQNTKER